MKSSIVRVVAGSALLFLFACSKEKSFEKSNSVPPVSSAADFTANINNVAWSAADSLRGASIISGIINITGISSDNKQISMTLNGSTTGTYILDQNSLSVGNYVDGNSENVFGFATNQGTDTGEAGGKVIVTEIDANNKTISGTFQFKVFRNMDSQQQVITEGVFNKIPFVTSLPPASTTDTFFVKVDGVDWSPPSITASVSAGILIIAASEQNGSRSVGLVMPATATTGNYIMDFATGDYFGEYSPNPTTFLISDSTGTLQIIDNNTSTRHVKGTFQFPAKDLNGGPQSAVLTEGSFSVGY
jgi:hypothetical protein